MLYQDIVTTNLAEFGVGQLRKAAELLTAYCEGERPRGFGDEGVTVAYNLHSGRVFLTNADADVAVLVGGALESFYVSPCSGHEGTFAELWANYSSDVSNEAWVGGDVRWLEELLLVRSGQEINIV
jgi:hypothetical protein